MTLNQLVQMFRWSTFSYVPLCLRFLDDDSVSGDYGCRFLSKLAKLIRRITRAGGSQLVQFGILRRIHRFDVSFSGFHL